MRNEKQEFQIKLKELKNPEEQKTLDQKFNEIRTFIKT